VSQRNFPIVRARVGKNVARFRRAKGMTQAEVAERFGCETDYVSRIERGKENLTLQSLTKLAELLDVEPAELLASEKK
jgi:transcriptional regulator with XRE-family HTH domain